MSLGEKIFSLGRRKPVFALIALFPPWRSDAHSELRTAVLESRGKSHRGQKSKTMSPQ